MLVTGRNQHLQQQERVQVRHAGCWTCFMYAIHKLKAVQVPSQEPAHPLEEKRIPAQ